VHDLHVWEITSGMPAASAHVLVAPRQDCHAVRADLETLFAREYGITHLTLQVDHAPEDPVGQPVPGHATGHATSEEHCEDAHGPRYLPQDAAGGFVGKSRATGEPRE
jgi:cobalt-zinc-cadmium efflux system protein